MVIVTLAIILRIPAAMALMVEHFPDCPDEMRRLAATYRQYVHQYSITTISCCLLQMGTRV